MDWNDAQQRGQRAWVDMRQRASFGGPRPEAPLHVKVLRLLVTAFIIGIGAIIAIAGIVIGLGVLALVAAILLVRRAWTALTGGIASGGQMDRSRRNVRVIERH